MAGKIKTKKMKAIKNIKQAFEGNNIITKVMTGLNGKVRIDAKTRNWQADKDNFFSEWCSEKYADKLSLERNNCKVRQLNCTQH